MNNYTNSQFLCCAVDLIKITIMKNELVTAWNLTYQFPKKEINKIARE